MDGGVVWLRVWRIAGMDASTRGPGEVARQWFGKVELGDRRRTRRLVASAERMMTHPHGTLPHKLGDPAALDGFYRLMESPTVTHDRLIAAAGAHTLAAMQAHDGVVLIVHDTTVLDYSGLHSIDHLGPIGDGHGRGLYAHNSLAVTTDRRVLGLAHQMLHVRRRVPSGETKAQRVQAEDRESRLWKEACQALPDRPGDRCWVDVADRGADVTEFLSFEQQARRLFLIRSCQNRRVEVIDASEQRVQSKLHDAIRQMTSRSMMHRTIRIPPRDRRPGREAELAVAWARMSLLGPRQTRGEHAPGERLDVWVVRVWEPDQPQRTSADSIEWILLTNVPVRDDQQAWERVDWYATRWVIEEYHKCLKTGLSIEQMQFTTRDRLDPAIALYSVIATWLLEWRDLSRHTQQSVQPATQVVPELWVLILSTWRHKQPRPDWTVGEFLLALARLGGHQNRKYDHPPGWLILWRGWIQLQSMIAGAQALAHCMQSLRCGET